MPVTLSSDSLFDDCLHSSGEAGDSVMGWDIIVNSVQIRGVVDEIDFSKRRMAGMTVKDIVCSIYITKDNAKLCDAVEGGIVEFKNRKVLIDTVADLGGGGLRLDCLQYNQMKTIPGIS
jgi:hypothetical protein